LINAARQTTGVLPEPKPFVLETELSDYYPCYQINAYIKDADKLGDIYSNLHQNIQDVFNEAGVEIMSPHYFAGRDGSASTIPTAPYPDDWVEPDAAEVLYHAARNADADCVEFGLYLDSYDENDRLLHTQTSGSTLSGVYRGAPFKEHFDETASSYLVTNKLFRRAFLEQHRLRFSCHQLGEDGLFFVAFYRQNPGCLVVLEKPLYHYTAARRGSLSNSYHPERLEDNFYLSDAVWDTVAAWGLQDSPMHRAKASYCTIRDLMMGIKNLGCSPLSLSEQTAWLRSTLQKPRVRTAVRSTPLHAMQSRNDQVKLLLLKLRLCRAVLLLSGANQRKNT
jgi:hypothetical protein